MSALNKYMFGSLPDYFSVNDTNKDSNDQGFLERYLSAFEEEFDDIKTLITSGLDIRDPYLTPSDMLQYISDMMMNPPAIPDNEVVIRKLLALIWNLNHIKGTLAGFEKYFFVLGITATITLIKNYNYKYDDGNIHDDMGEDDKYDTDCNTCTHTAVITLVWIDGTILTYPEHDLGDVKVTQIIEHLLPINIKWSVFQHPLPTPLPVTDPFGDDSELIHYKLTEDLLDSEGNFDGDNLSTAPTFLVKDMNLVLNTDSNPIYISNYEDGSALQLTEFSVSTWVNLSTVDTLQRFMHWHTRYAGAPDPANQGVMGYIENKKIHIGYPQPSTVAYSWVSEDASDDGSGNDAFPQLEYGISTGWVHIGVTIKDQVIRLFLDGVHVSTMTTSVSPVYGGELTPPSALFAKVREDVPGTKVVTESLRSLAYASTTRVFNRALDDTEMDQLFNEKIFTP